jgi:hypothetical protein
MVSENLNKDIKQHEESKSNRYDYFSICNNFVNKIKILNELKDAAKIKSPGFS